MRILITGGTGYLGTRVVRQLIKNGNSVILLVLPNSSTEMFRGLSNIEVYTTAKENIEMIMQTNIDCVLHLATLYGRKGESSQEILEANLLFPLNLLEIAMKNEVKYFFNMDTAIHKLIDKYTISKKQFRDWGKYYGNQEKVRFVNMKTEHFYGPFDNEIKFIANMLKQLKSNKEYIETTLGEQERAFIYIDDLVNAIHFIINNEMKKDKLEFTEYEIGPDSNIKIKDALMTMKEMTNSKSQLKFGAIPYRKNEEMESKCDNRKLKEIGWTQEIKTFEEGIKKILEEEK